MDDMLTCLLLSLAKAMGPERVSLRREQRSMRQRRTAAASMELATAAGYIGEHGACYNDGLHWRPLRDEGGLRLRHPAVDFLPDE